MTGASLPHFWRDLRPALSMQLIPVLALLGLLVPSYLDVARGWWKYDEHAYAALLAALAFGLVAFELRRLRVAPDAGVPLGGLLLLLLGAGGYVIGRSQQIELLELAACIALMASVLALLAGRAALKQLRFALLFLLFSLPYPGWFIDALTSPLKALISLGAESLLYAAGYPVARSGVMLSLGPYRLLVADACSGLHSLVFLSALGLLYVHLSGQRRTVHRLVLVAALLPIAVLANFVRVLVLLLLTYHFGDAVGQGYWHDLAGLLLYLCAFAMLSGLDALLSRWPAPAGSPGLAQGEHVAHTATAAPGWRRSLTLTVALLAVAGAAILLTPSLRLAQQRAVPDLQSQVPQSFGGWVQDVQADVLLVAPDLQASVQRLYNQTLARTYVNRQGQRIMLSIAYGGTQRGNELQAHRPEYCYKAQGFTLRDAHDTHLALPGGHLPLRRLVAQQHNRVEPISYWMTVGDTAALPGLQRKWAQLRYGLRGEIPDGMLVRVSSIDRDSGRAFELQASFITELQGALPQSLRFILPESTAQR